MVAVSMTGARIVNRNSERRRSPRALYTPLDASHRESAAALVVGSRAIEVAEDRPEALRCYISSLRGAIDEAKKSCGSDLFLKIGR